MEWEETSHTFAFVL